jgi:hypothetical protein
LESLECALIVSHSGNNSGVLPLAPVLQTYHNRAHTWMRRAASLCRCGSVRRGASKRGGAGWRGKIVERSRPHLEWVQTVPPLPGYFGSGPSIILDVVTPLWVSPLSASSLCLLAWRTQVVTSEHRAARRNPAVLLLSRPSFPSPSLPISRTLSSGNPHTSPAGPCAGQLACCLSESQGWQRK